MPCPCHLLPKNELELKRSEISAFSCEKGVAFGGTVSAEHGIGKTAAIFRRMYGKAAILEMARIKKAFDPNVSSG